MCCLVPCPFIAITHDYFYFGKWQLVVGKKSLDVLFISCFFHINYELFLPNWNFIVNKLLRHNNTNKERQVRRGTRTALKIKNPRFPNSDLDSPPSHPIWYPLYSTFMPILGSQKPYKLHASSLTRSSWHERDTTARSGGRHNAFYFYWSAGDGGAGREWGHWDYKDVQNDR